MNPKEDHANQHTVSKKYLAAWQDEATKKLIQYQRLPGEKFASKEVSAKATGFIPHVYSIENENVDPEGNPTVTYDNYLETEFFTAEIDSPIGNVLKKIRENKSVEKLDSTEKSLWAKFLVAQHLRVPYTLERNAIIGAIQFLESKQQQMLAAPPPFTEEDWKRRRDFVSDTLAAHEREGENNSKHALPIAINSKTALGPILSAYWTVIDISHLPNTFIIGDHPVIWQTFVNKGLSIFIPLSPRLLFFATNSSSEYLDIFQISREDLVQELNKQQAQAAKTYVWARNDSNEELVRRYLPKRPWNLEKKKRPNSRK